MTLFSAKVPCMYAHATREYLETTMNTQLKCLYCGNGFEQRSSSAVYSEAFCSAGCEKAFVEHVGKYYGVADPNLRIVAIMPQGNA